MDLLDAIEQYKQNVDWRGNIAKARLFEQAALIIHLERAQGNTQAGTQLQFADISEQIKRVQKYLDVASPSKTRRYFTAGRVRRR